MREDNMRHIVIFDFPSEGPFGAEAADAYRELAEDIATQRGLVWKVWTEDAAQGTAGGVYLFENRVLADAYIEFQTHRLASFGITDIVTARHDVNETLSALTHATLTRS